MRRACGLHAACMRCACGVHAVCMRCACDVHTMYTRCARGVHAMCTQCECCVHAVCACMQCVRASTCSNSASGFSLPAEWAKSHRPASDSMDSIHLRLSDSFLPCMMPSANGCWMVSTCAERSWSTCNAVAATVERGVCVHAVCACGGGEGVGDGESEGRCRRALGGESDGEGGVRGGRGRGKGRRVSGITIWCRAGTCVPVRPQPCGLGRVLPCLRLRLRGFPSDLIRRVGPPSSTHPPTQGGTHGGGARCGRERCTQPSTGTGGARVHPACIASTRPVKARLSGASRACF
jgi:hypothetical protein